MSYVSGSPTAFQPSSGPTSGSDVRIMGTGFGVALSVGLHWRAWALALAANDAFSGTSAVFSSLLASSGVPELSSIAAAASSSSPPPAAVAEAECFASQFGPHNVSFNYVGSASSDPTIRGCASKDSTAWSDSLIECITPEGVSGVSNTAQVCHSLLSEYPLITAECSPAGLGALYTYQAANLTSVSAVAADGSPSSYFSTDGNYSVVISGASLSRLMGSSTIDSSGDTSGSSSSSSSSASATLTGTMTGSMTPSPSASATAGSVASSSGSSSASATVTSSGSYSPTSAATPGATLSMTPTLTRTSSATPSVTPTHSTAAVVLSSVTCTSSPVPVFGAGSLWEVTVLLTPSANGLVNGGSSVYGPIAVDGSNHSAVQFTMPKFEGSVAAVLQYVWSRTTIVFTSHPIVFSASPPTITAIYSFPLSDDPCLVLLEYPLLRNASSTNGAVDLSATSLLYRAATNKKLLLPPTLAAELEAMWDETGGWDGNVTYPYPLVYSGSGYSPSPCISATAANLPQLLIIGSGFGSGQAAGSSVVFTAAGRYDNGTMYTATSTCTPPHGNTLTSSSTGEMLCQLNSELPRGPVNVSIHIAFASVDPATSGIAPVIRCPIGFFADSDGSLCAACNSGGFCPGAAQTQLALADFWKTVPAEWMLNRSIDVTDKNAPVAPFVQCAVLGLCLAAQACVEGSSGFMCVFCDPNFARGYDGLCSPCEPTNVRATMAAIITILLIAPCAIIVWFTCIPRRRMRGYLQTLAVSLRFIPHPSSATIALASTSAAAATASTGAAISNMFT